MTNLKVPGDTVATETMVPSDRSSDRSAGRSSGVPRPRTKVFSEHIVWATAVLPQTWRLFYDKHPHLVTIFYISTRSLNRLIILTPANRQIYVVYGEGSVFEKGEKEENRKESQQAAQKGRPWFDSWSMLFLPCFLPLYADSNRSKNVWNE
jgi:hypothetical protein